MVSFSKEEHFLKCSLKKIGIGNYWQIINSHLNKSFAFFMIDPILLNFYLVVSSICWLDNFIMSAINKHDIRKVWTNTGVKNKKEIQVCCVQWKQSSGSQLSIISSDQSISSNNLMFFCQMQSLYGHWY